MDQYEFAKHFATIMHHGQTYGDKPYTYHLEQVELVLNKFGFDDPVFSICAWLHDIIEDVPGVTFSKLKFGFGTEIADIVFSVTNNMGRDRKERFRYTYNKIRENKKALIVKLADRIANIENGLGRKTSYVKMYKREWPDFKSSLLDVEETDERVKKMWTYLGLLFEDGENE